MSVPPEPEPVPLSRASTDGREIATIAVALGILAFIAIGLLKPWTAVRSPGPASSGAAVVASSLPALPHVVSPFAVSPPLDAAAPVEGIGASDRSVVEDVWRRVGPPLTTDVVLAAVHSGIDAVDPNSGQVRSFLICGCDPRGALAASPSGTTLAYADTVDDVVYLRTLDLTTLRSNTILRCVACAEDGFDFSWSPDGRMLAFSAAAGIWTVAADGSVVHRLLTTGRSPTFSPDGSRLLFDGIGTVNVDGTGFAALGLPWAIGTTWSPDGSRIAYATTALGPSTQAWQHDPHVQQLWVANIDGSHAVRLAERPGCCIDAATAGAVWSPDGTRLVWSAGVERELIVIGADRSSPRAVAAGVHLLPVRPTWLRVPARPPGRIQGVAPLRAPERDQGSGRPERAISESEY